MSSLKFSRAGFVPAPRSARETALQWVALGLRGTSARLARWSRCLTVPANAAPPLPPPQLEFYAEAGAPEGALYLDGRLVGWINGVRRL